MKSFPQPLKDEQNLQTAWLLCVLICVYSVNKSYLPYKSWGRRPGFQPCPFLLLRPFEIQQHETLGRPLWVRKYTDTAFTVLLLARVSNACLHKTSHHKLQSEKSEHCRHFINQSNTRREKKYIKKLIHSTNYLWWVGRTNLAELH